MSSMDNLFEQFKKAMGYEELEIDGAMIEEFIAWINLQKKMGNTYSHLLDEMGLNYQNNACAEVGKGKYDSLVSNCDTTVINTDDYITNKGLHIISGFRIFNGKPTLVKQETPKKISFKQINTKIINKFMTQNPYNEHLIDNWDELHNYNIAQIIIGVFGNIHDKNIKMQKEILKKFKQKLSNQFLYESVNYGDIYCDVVATNPNVKVLK